MDAPPSEQPSPAEGRADLLSTSRALRLAMVLVLVVLLGAVLLQGLTDCAQSTISGFYFTAVRPVFVGSLCALGVCLVVYRGSSDREDVALNLTGFLAVVVAFVPTETPLGDRCPAANVPTDDEIQAMVANNVTVLVAVGVMGLAIAYAMLRGVRRTNPSVVRWSVGFPAVCLALGTLWFLLDDGGFIDHAHGVAALVMFGLIILVVHFNAQGAGCVDRGQPAWREPERLYGGIRNAMLLSALLVVAGAALDRALGGAWPFWGLLAEAMLLLEFLVFWLVQTDELWDVTSRKEVLVEGG